MDRRKSQFWRLLELDRKIRAGKYPNCRSFGRDWNVSEKTVLRDTDYMRYALNAPLDFDRKRNGYFYSDKTWFLPSLLLSEGELYSLLMSSRALEVYRGTPLGGELKKLFAKLAELLPEQIAVPPEYLFSHFSFTLPPAKPVDKDVWVGVVRGLLHRRSLKIRYQSFGARHPKNHLIDPYHMANLQGEWYVFAWSHTKNMLVQFALARIKTTKVTDSEFRLPPDFDPKRLVDSAFGRFASDEQIQDVKLQFDKTVADWVLDRQWHPSQKTEVLPGGEVILSLKVAGLFEVMRWVLSWGKHVMVLAPEELKALAHAESL